MIIFGIRSPFVIEIEETLGRLGVAIEAGISVNGTPRLLERGKIVELDSYEPQEGAHFITAAFSPKRRRELTGQAKALGLVPAPALVDPTAILPKSLRIGAGTFVNAGAVIGGMSMIGEGVLVNRAASVGHHCIIGDMVSIGPGATLASNIQVGANSVIGAGAVILPDVRIGNDVVIAAGSVVRKPVEDGALVSGNPAVAKSFKPRRSSLNVENAE